ncbi:HEPN domain-containing protein [Chloroflexota bacterium]
MPRKLAQKLLRKADQDIVVINKWYSDADVADEILGFHAQQATEKLLKAVLSNAEIEFPFTHRLTDLIDLLKDHGIDFPDDLDDVRYLTPFAVEFRYDFFEQDEDPLDREDLVKLLAELRAWVSRIISS